MLITSGQNKPGKMRKSKKENNLKFCFIVFKTHIALQKISLQLFITDFTTVKRYG